MSKCTVSCFFCVCLNSDLKFTVACLQHSSILLNHLLVYLLILFNYLPNFIESDQSLRLYTEIIVMFFGCKDFVHRLDVLYIRIELKVL